MDCMRDNFVSGALLNRRFETVSALNHGSFGQVFLAKDKISRSLVALKCLTKASAALSCPSQLAIDDRSEELSIHARIGYHPHVVNLITSFESETHNYLVLEFCPNGDLYEAIRLEKGPRETEHVRDFMLQIVDALEFLHAKGIYHRDIKPENIFLTTSGAAKLGDFGLATAESWSFEAAVGSDRYMAPEQYEPPSTGYSTAAADIWALGICLLNVLFARNPFGTPTWDDPLFHDFSLDRQSLFDVFPNMHQDTYEVLVHCLSIDPSKRSLAAVKEALRRVVSFTCEDEVFDDFCTDNRTVIPATANREPLRTPSVQSPQLDNGSFPWAKALAMSSLSATRQLSGIPDTESYAESLFPGSAQSPRDWDSVRPDTASIASVLDSGLGASINSANLPQTLSVRGGRSQPIAISSSVPVRSPRLSSSALYFTLGKDEVSKSWSDLWDEEEEEQNDELREHIAVAAKHWTEDSASSGPATPRCALAELKNPSLVNSRSNSPAVFSPKHVNEHTGFIFEDNEPATPRCSSPLKRSFLDTPRKVIMDKWAALGERRRGLQAGKAQMVTPPNTGNAKHVKRQRSRTRSGTRRTGLEGLQWSNDSGVSFGSFKHGNESRVWEMGKGERKDDWSLSTDWRRSEHSLPQEPSSLERVPDVNCKNGKGDIPDLEWVGGWKDLQL